MCHYCGCRELPLIRDYVAEHERATDLGDTAVRAIDHGDLDKARRSLVQMAVELASHWDGEENGIFRAVQSDPMYAEYKRRWSSSTGSRRNCSRPLTWPTPRTSNGSAPPRSSCGSTSSGRRTASFPHR
jgi:hypothetical protein